MEEQYRLLKNDLDKFLEILRKSYPKIIGPSLDNEEREIFKEITNVNELKLDRTIPLKPPKEFLFPQSEELFKFSFKEGKFDLKDENCFEKQVLFALRPCDLTAIKYTDTFFTSNFIDSYYSVKRENSLIVGIACEYPSNKCFCTSMGVSPVSSEGSDIFLTNGGSFFLVEFLTEKALSIREQFAGLLKEASLEDATLKNRIEKRTRSLLLEEFDLGKVREGIDKIYGKEELFRKYSDACVMCGACTFNCPTCTCFDVSDKFTDKDSGKRYRTWDSCSFYNFSLHASGHNPRSRKVERLRQRIMHKFNYTVKQFNLWSCIGCGRCIAVCPVGINTKSIAKDLQREASNENK